MKKYVWKPIDIDKLRLYQVKVMFHGHPNWDMVKIVLARTPTHARELIEKSYEGNEWIIQPTFWSGALDIYQPAEWHEIGYQLAKDDEEITSVFTKFVSGQTDNLNLTLPPRPRDD